MDYRREIDGLRALAVVPVILFHGGFQAFSGGFVGVDIFFVISGYLITTIIFTEVKQGKFSIINFYERRARRILPALFFVMLVSLPFVWFWLLPQDILSFSQSLIAVSTFTSNLFFWRTSGYFDAAAELKPLLHTWSLAVEEQYYVIFPLLFLFIWRLGKSWIFTLFVLIALISLASAQYFSVAKPEFNFYLLPTRSWELLIGALVAIYYAEHSIKNYKYWLVESGSLIGFAFILYSIFTYDNQTPFPSLYALLPTLGTVLIIIFATPQTMVGTLLGSKLLVAIGLISYSAYLWHQPLLAFLRHRSLDEPSMLLLSISLIALLPLAYLTWRYIEQPFRNKHYLSRKQFFVFAVVGSILFIGTGIVGYKTNGFQSYFISKLPNEKKDLLTYVEHGEKSDRAIAWRSRTCFIHSKSNSFKYFDKQNCLRLSPTKKNYLLVGDSHAAHIWQALSRNYTDVNFLQATASGCKPVINSKGEKRCTDLIEFIYREFLSKNKVDGIILSARWQSNSVSDLIRTTRFLEKLNIPVFVIGPTIEFTSSLPYILLKQDHLSFNYINRSSNYLVSDRFELSNRLKRAYSLEHTHYVDLQSVICDTSRCITAMNNAPISFDYGHFTVKASNAIISRLKERGELQIK